VANAMRTVQFRFKVWFRTVDGQVNSQGYPQELNYLVKSELDHTDG
jgi:hypothetical protein